MTDHEVVSREEWNTARIALLEKEKAFTRLRDELSAARHKLPWVRIDREEGCPSCSFRAYNFNGVDVHLGHRDMLDLTALGRHEDGKGMFWLRRKDQYEDS